MKRSFELCGHRGARGLWPENTLAGFAGTLALGVHALEFDVVLTADGVPVVSHDLWLNPDMTRGSDGAWLDATGPAIRSLKASALSRCDVGRARPGSAVARAHPRQAARDGERIPALAALFRLVSPHARVRLDVELKTDPAQAEASADPGDLADAVLAEAAMAHVLDRVVLRSFDWRGLRHAAQRRPDLPLAFLTEDASASALQRVRAAAANRPADWAPRFSQLTPALIERAHSEGLAVTPWTVNREEDMARLIAWGVDGFCTDDPDIARRVMAEAGLTPPEPLSLPRVAQAMPAGSVSRP